MLAALAAAGGAETNTAEWTHLNQTRQWFSHNPPDGTNATERRKQMAPIQTACDQLPPSDYAAYVKAWDSRAGQADSMEEANPALRYLRASSLQAMADIRRTRVKQGVSVWLLYNMGYVFKTPTACFGIDLCGRDMERLAPDLDFLLVSHSHEDHFSAPLIKSMLAQRKPVLTRWFDGTTLVKENTTYTFGDVQVKVDIGDHHHDQPNGRDNMLMFEVDCGSPGNNAVIYHSGDGDNFEKMHPTKPVDVFIPHVAVGMSVPDAINYLKPKMTLVSHVLELGHSPVPPNAWRWSYEYAFNVIRDIPENRATVLTWGERWLLPGTELQEETRE